MPSTRVPRRVLLVEQNVNGTAGGSYQALFDLARGLDRARYTPVVLFYQSNRFVPRLTALGVTVLLWPKERRVGGRLVNVIAGIVRRAKFLWRHRIDLVHLNDTPAVGSNDWMPAAWLLSLPCLTAARGIVRPAADPIHRWLQRRFDFILADSRHVADAVIASVAPADRVRVVYEGVDADAFRGSIRQSGAAIRERYGVEPDAILVVMVGHLRPWKGQHVVVDALSRVTTARDRLRTLFVGGTPSGEEPYEATLRASVAAAGLDRVVTFVGESEDVADLMNAADIVVHASTRPEPFGIVVVEGLALGKAVVASALGGPLEIITPGTGLLFDTKRPEELAAILDRLASDAGLRAELGRAAVARADVFSVRELVKGTEAAYDRTRGAR